MMKGIKHLAPTQRPLLVRACKGTNIEWGLTLSKAPSYLIAQSAGAAEYTDCTSAEG